MTDPFCGSTKCLAAPGYHRRDKQLPSVSAPSRIRTLRSGSSAIGHLELFGRDLRRTFERRLHACNGPSLDEHVRRVIGHSGFSSYIASKLDDLDSPHGINRRPIAARQRGCPCILRGVDFELTSEMAFLRNRPQRADDAYRPGYGTVGARPTASLASKHAPSLARRTIPVSITIRPVSSRSELIAQAAR